MNEPPSIPPKPPEPDEAHDTDPVPPDLPLDPDFYEETKPDVGIA